LEILPIQVYEERVIAAMAEEEEVEVVSKLRGHHHIPGQYLPQSVCSIANDLDDSNNVEIQMMICRKRLRSRGG